jgi:hypothetical protein
MPIIKLVPPGHSHAALVFENYVEMLQIDDQMVEFSLWDTAGNVSSA